MASSSLVFRLHDRGPELVRKVLLEHGWKEYDGGEQEEEDWNLYWRASAFRSSDYHNLLPWQRLNHHPKTVGITRKDCLVRNLRRMRATFGSSLYHFSPAAFILPNDHTRFLSEYTRRRQTGGWSPYWICKPVDLSQGRGIFIFEDYKDLIYDSSVVIQRYISNPLLISGYKFDLRIYVCVKNFHPLTIYMHQEGLVRFATDKYNLSSLDNLYAHLTNTSINKLGPFYTTNKERVGQGCKWAMNKFRCFLRSQGINELLLWQKINNIVTLTLLSIAPSVPSSPNCVELFGFDVLIDSKFKPWLLEVNSSPALTLDCQVDVAVKKGLISDLIDLMNYRSIDSLRERAYRKQLPRYHASQASRFSTPVATFKELKSQKTSGSRSSQTPTQSLVKARGQHRADQTSQSQSQHRADQTSQSQSQHSPDQTSQSQSQHHPYYQTSQSQSQHSPDQTSQSQSQHHPYYQTSQSQSQHRPDQTSQSQSQHRADQTSQSQSQHRPYQTSQSQSQHHPYYQTSQSQSHHRPDQTSQSQSQHHPYYQTSQSQSQHHPYYQTSQSQSQHRPDQTSQSQSHHRPDQTSQSQSQHRPDQTSQSQSQHRPDQTSQSQSQHHPNQTSQSQSQHRPDQTSQSQSQHHPNQTSQSQSQHRPDQTSQSQSHLHSVVATGWLKYLPPVDLNKRHAAREGIINSNVTTATKPHTNQVLTPIFVPHSRITISEVTRQTRGPAPAPRTLHTSEVTHHGNAETEMESSGKAGVSSETPDLLQMGLGSLRSKPAAGSWKLPHIRRCSEVSVKHNAVHLNTISQLAQIPITGKMNPRARLIEGSGPVSAVHH